MAELYGFAASPDEAEILMNAGVKVIQYRNKSEDHQEMVRSVKEILSRSAGHPDVKIIVNDSLQAALDSGAHGVHLGQDDGDYREICSRCSILVGVSIDTVEEALEAQEAGASYIGAGAVFGSETKPEAPYMGLPLLRDICAAVNLPVSAIGGITLNRVDEICAAGAAYVCVISDINGHPDPSERVREYLERLKDLESKKESVYESC
ncbi:MAG: thiamine phosphate synthase [Spirochaetales bacterium]|nr:thiamine phosphate synthase [Spirochaetales bacterium]